MNTLKHPATSTLGRALHRVWRLRRRDKAPKFYATFAQAQQACVGQGYADPVLVQTVFEKTMLAKEVMLEGKYPMSLPTHQSIIAVLTALAESEKRGQLKVVDLGGACGAHYFQIRPFVPADVKLDWVVVETAEMAERARALEMEELRFCSLLSEAVEQLGGVDLVHSSGALPYMPNPIAILEDIMACSTKCIFLNRLALSIGETLIAIQDSLLSANGPGPLPEYVVDRLCRYPITYVPKRQVEVTLAGQYTVRFAFPGEKRLVANKEMYSDVGLFAVRIG